MPHDTKVLKTDKNKHGIPQYFNVTADDYEDHRGRNGAAYVELLDSTGTPFDTSGGKLPVSDGDAGTKIDAATMPAGGAGKVGWLSAIWHKLGSVILAAGDAVIGRVKVTDGTTVAKVNTDGSLPVQLTGSSVQQAFAVTPHDTNALANTTIALYVGVDGDVKVDLAGVGTGIVFKNLVAGTFYPIKATKVYATGTTATNIVGVY